MAMRGERWRFWLPVAGLLLFAAYCGQKLVRAHVDPQVEDVDYTFTKQVPARRGSIYDRFGKECPLVKSIPVWEYYLDPFSLTNRVVKRRGEPRRPPKAIVKTIAQALRLDYKKVLAMATGPVKPGYRNQYLTASSDRAGHDIVANSKLVAGVRIDDCQVRQYLHKRRLSHVIGSVNAEHVGSAGLELKYNTWLSGFPGEIQGIRDARGNELYDKRKVSVDPVPGADIYLTIDHNIQYEAETALAWGLKEYGAGSGWCLVMDAKTGGVLAMASLPDFNPQFFGSAKESAKVNRCVAFTYEPGSVMKVITAAATYDAGFTTPGHIYSTDRFDERYYRLPGDAGHKWEPTMTVKDAIVHSSNIVIGKLGYDFGPQRLFKYQRAFGFGQRTGIELPGEEVGIHPDPSRRMWDKASWSRAAIGQFVAVTAIQLCSAYQAIANDGVRMPPHIVEKIVAADGSELYRPRTEPLSRPVSAKAARMIRETMLDVASSKGTARRAAIRGYSVSGKTGTAQKAIPGGRGYLPGVFRATFCGIVPSGTLSDPVTKKLHEPQIVVLVTLDFDTKQKFHQGGNSSGPVFRRLATAALRYLSVPPDKPEELAESEDDDAFDQIMDDRAEEAEARDWEEEGDGHIYIPGRKQK